MGGSTLNIFKSSFHNYIDANEAWEIVSDKTKL